MRKRGEYLAGFLEKASVGLFIAAFVRDNSMPERVAFGTLALAALAIGYYLTKDEE